MASFDGRLLRALSLVISERSSGTSVLTAGGGLDSSQSWRSDLIFAQGPEWWGLEDSKCLAH